VAAAELIGDVVLFRNDDNAEPVDLSLAEWKDFCEVNLRCSNISLVFRRTVLSSGMCILSVDSYPHV
jgi:hypothetical protein